MKKQRRFLFQKLVRDQVQTILVNKGIDVTSKQLPDKEYLAALHAKFLEELLELQEAQTPAEITEELADVLELLYAFSEHHQIPVATVEEKRQQKKAISGGFKKGIFIESVALSEDHPELQRFLTQPAKYPELP